MNRKVEQKHLVNANSSSTNKIYTLIGIGHGSAFGLIPNGGQVEGSTTANTTPNPEA